MRLAIMKAFLPWLFFFGCADGTLLGLKWGVIIGFICLFLFGRKGLVKRFILEWAAFIFLAGMFMLGWVLQNSWVIQYSLFIENVFLAGVCFLSLIIGRPFSLEHARLLVDKSQQNNPLLIGVNYWISFVWGLVFSVCATFVVLFHLKAGPALWLLKIFPTSTLILGMVFTIFFPDKYKAHVEKTHI